MLEPVVIETSDARRRAIVALNTGHYEEAIKGFEEAYAQDQDPILLFRLAQAYRLAGQPTKALDACEAYLRAADGNAADRAQVEHFLSEVEMIAYQIRLQREYGALPQPLQPRTALTPTLASPTRPPPLALQPAPLDGDPTAPSAFVPTPKPPIDSSINLTKAPTPHPIEPTPAFYQRTPFWVAVGGAVVAGAAVVWYTQRSHGDRAPQTALGYQQAFP